MRIIGKECRKILDIRLLLIIAVFTFLFYNLFMQITIYPTGGQCTDSPYDIPFAVELVQEIGPVLSLGDRSVLEDKINELKQEYNEVIASDEILQKAGITNYDVLRSREEILRDTSEEEMTKEDEAVMREIDYLTYSNEKTSRLSFQIQYAGNVDEFRGSAYGVSPAEADALVEERYGDYATELFKTAKKEKCTKDYVSLIPEGVFYIIQEDMRHMAVLLIICFFILMVPYQVRERLRGVTSLYATTRTGRKIFGRQFVAGLLSCGMVGFIQLLIYLGIYGAKGLMAFWKCPAWSRASNMYWLDFLPFGAYMIIYMLLVWFFAMTALVLAYWIGRKAVNYVAGIAISIPVGGTVSFGASALFVKLFYIDERVYMAFWELIVILVWLVFAGIMLAVRLKRDRKRDILL